MKFRGFVIALVGMVLTTAAVFAQPKNMEFQLGGGLGLPVSPEEFTTPFSMGFSAFGSGAYFVTPQLVVGANVAFNQFGFDESAFTDELDPDIRDEVEISGGNLSIIEIAGLAKYYLQPAASRTSVYGIGSVGLAMSRISDIEVKSPEGSFTSESDSQSNFFVAVGAGVKQQLRPNLSVFGEVRYNIIFDDDNASFMPFRIGVNF